MGQDWRIYRPAIWLGMLGIALILLVSPPYIGGAVVGGAIGIVLRIGFGLRPVDRARRQSAQGRRDGRGAGGSKAQGGGSKGQRRGRKRPS